MHSKLLQTLAHFSVALEKDQLTELDVNQVVAVWTDVRVVPAPRICSAGAGPAPDNKTKILSSYAAASQRSKLCANVPACCWP